MAYRRTLIPDFNLANPIYAYATVYVYGVSGGAKDTSNRPPLYDALAGGNTLANPQKLDEHGKWVQPVYVDEPIVVEAVPLHAASHDTGIIEPTIDNQGITMSYAGDPNGNVAGDYLGQRLLDTTNDRIYTCTTTGLAASAVWTLFGHNSSAFAGDLLDDANAAAMRTTLGLGTAALIDTGVANGNVPAMDGTGYPAADGSQITNVAAATVASVTAAQGSSLVLLGSSSPSGAVSVDMPGLIISTYDVYLLKFWDIVPSTDDQWLYIRLSNDNGSTYRNGASDYSWTADVDNSLGTGVGLWDDTSNRINLSDTGAGQGAGNAAGESMAGFAWIFNPLNASFKTLARAEISCNSAEGILNRIEGSGMVNTAEANNAIQLLFASANITGEVRFYGLKGA